MKAYYYLRSDASLRARATLTLEMPRLPHSPERATHDKRRRLRRKDVVDQCARDIFAMTST